VAPDWFGHAPEGTPSNLDNGKWIISGEDPFTTYFYAGLAGHFALVLNKLGISDTEGIDWKKEAAMLLTVSSMILIIATLILQYSTLSWKAKSDRIDARMNVVLEQMEKENANTRMRVKIQQQVIEHELQRNFGT
jgi:hypothetical protein